MSADFHFLLAEAVEVVAAGALDGRRVRGEGLHDYESCLNFLT